MCSSETILFVCVSASILSVCLFLCACACVFVHVVTCVRVCVCVFSLRDALVTGAELIVADGCRQAQTYILLCHTEEEGEEEVQEGNKNWGLLYSSASFISPLSI